MLVLIREFGIRLLKDVVKFCFLSNHLEKEFQFGT